MYLDTTTEKMHDDFIVLHWKMEGIFLFQEKIEEKTMAKEFYEERFPLSLVAHSLAKTQTQPLVSIWTLRLE